MQFLQAPARRLRIDASSCWQSCLCGNGSDPGLTPSQNHIWANIFISCYIILIPVPLDVNQPQSINFLNNYAPLSQLQQILPGPSDQASKSGEHMSSLEATLTYMNIRCPHLVLKKMSRVLTLTGMQRRTTKKPQVPSQKFPFGLIPPRWRLTVATMVRQ